MHYTPYIFFVQSKNPTTKTFSVHRGLLCSGLWIHEYNAYLHSCLACAMVWFLRNTVLMSNIFLPRRLNHDLLWLSFECHKRSLFFFHNLDIFPSDRRWLRRDKCLLHLLSFPPSMSYHLTPPPLSPIQRTMHPPPRPPFKGWFFVNRFYGKVEWRQKSRGGGRERKIALSAPETGGGFCVRTCRLHEK